MLYQEQFSYTEELKKAFYPVGSGKDVETIDFYGTTAYTSNKLKDNVIESIRKHLPKQTAKIISDQINYGRVIPAFLTKGIFDYIIKRRKFKTHSLGQAYKGKAFIFLDRLYEKFKLVSVDEKKLANLMLHELMHVAEHLNISAYYKVNYKLFIEFWKTFFTKYFDLKKNAPNKIFDQMLKYQINFVRKGRSFDFEKMYSTVFKNLKQYSKMDDELYKDLANDLMNFANKTYDEGKQQGVKYSDIPEAQDAAYKKIGGVKSPTFGQELWNPTEIMSMIAEHKPTHPNVIKTLQIIK